jgi:hypothetical protein
LGDPLPELFQACDGGSLGEGDQLMVEMSQVPSPPFGLFQKYESQNAQLLPVPNATAKINEAKTVHPAIKEQGTKRILEFSEPGCESPCE